ncbi:MAG: TatD family hydrolase [Desulfuromonadales bacterium]
MIKAFDTHLHLDAFDDLKRHLDEARSAGIDGWVVPGVSPDGWSKILAIAEGQSGVHAAPGVHPFSANRYRSENAEELRTLVVFSTPSPAASRRPAELSMPDFCLGSAA